MHSTESVHCQNRSIVQVIIPEARPGPLVGRTHQAALDGIAMHVMEFLEPLPVAVDVERVKPPLPNPVTARLAQTPALGGVCVFPEGGVLASILDSVGFKLMAKNRCARSQTLRG